MSRLICLIPPERADRLLGALREHLSGDPAVDVLIERRVAPEPGAGAPRAPVAERDPAAVVPPELRPEARDVRLVQRLEPLGRTHEDVATEELVRDAAAGNADAVSELWWRVAPRALARLRRRVGKQAGEEDGGRLLGCVLDELPGYHAAREPLDAWLDGVVDRYAIRRGHPESARTP